MNHRKIFWGAALSVALIVGLSGCGGPEGQGEARSGGGPGTCEIPDSLERLSTTPIGVLYPSGGFDEQSYSSAQEIADAGLTAVSLGWSILYDSDGNIVYDWDGSADDDAKARWISRMQCSVIEAKQAGLVVAVWGQFQEAGVNAEPGLIRDDIREQVLAASVGLIPEMAEAVEAVKAEYYSPVAELDKFGGIEGHNTYFPQYLEAVRPVFSGILYSQPNVLQRDPSFYSEQLTPALEGIDALGISWISYDCAPEDVAKGDWFVEQAAAQGVTTVYISEIGGVQQAPETQATCMTELIERWGGVENGVFALDTPSMLEDHAFIKGSWQENVLLGFSEQQ